MQVGRVIGRVTSTTKHSSLRGQTLLLVQPLGVGNQDDGDPMIAIDAVGSRRGDAVMVSSDGKAVQDMLQANDTPVRYAILGIFDETMDAS